MRLLGQEVMHEFTITDDDSAMISLTGITTTSTTLDVVESSGNAVIGLMLDKPAKNEVVATYTITADSATATDDYTPPNPLTVSIPSGATEGTISIPIVDDTTYEEDETFTVNVTSVTNVSNASPNLSVAVTIVDNEDESTLTGPTTAVSVTETDSGTNGSATFNVSLSPASKDPVTLIYNTMVGSASTSDFTAITNDPEVTIAAGQTQLASDISITVIGDDLQEGDEEFFVAITIKNDSTTKAKIDGTPARLSRTNYYYR